MSGIQMPAIIIIAIFVGRVALIANKCNCNISIITCIGAVVGESVLTMNLADTGLHRVL